jgi:hypothetical protein
MRNTRDHGTLDTLRGSSLVGCAADARKHADTLGVAPPVITKRLLLHDNCTNSNVVNSYTSSSTQQCKKKMLTACTYAGDAGIAATVTSLEQ